MLINTLSKHYHISVRTLRYYEEIGLLSAGRNKNNQRTFSSSEIAKLENILLFKSLGFKLKDIKDIIDDNIELHRLIVDQLVKTNDAIMTLVETKEKLENLIQVFQYTDLDHNLLTNYLKEQIYLKDERWIHMTQSKNITITLGGELIPIALESTKDNLLSEIRSLRASLKSKHQLEIPLIRVMDIETLEPLTYEIKVNDHIYYTKTFKSLDVYASIDDIITQLKAYFLN